MDVFLGGGGTLLSISVYLWAVLCFLFRLDGGRVDRKWQGCSGFWDTEARNCVPLMSKWLDMLNTLVSAWMWAVGDDLVQPVAIFSALFCTICNLFVLEFDIDGAQLGLA